MAIASIGIMYGAGGSSIRFPSASDELVIQTVSDATTAIFPTVGSCAIVGAVPGRQPVGHPREVGVDDGARVRAAATSACRSRRRTERPAASASSAWRIRETSTEPETSTARNAAIPAISARRCNDHSLGSLSARPSVGGEGGSREGSAGTASRGRRDAPAGRRGARRVRPPRRDGPRRPLARSARSSRSTPAWMRSGERLTSGSSRLTARSSRSTAVTGSRRRGGRYSSSEITFPMAPR